MEVETDPNLLVVNLEHCVSTETRHLAKSSCIYTTIPPNSCGHDVLQLATPVQCIGDLNQPLSRIQHQHVTQLQPLQYPQMQVSYDNGSLQQSNSGLLTGGAPIYQAPPQPTTLHHYHQAPPPPPPAQTYHGSYLTPLSVAPHTLQEYSPLIAPPVQQNLQESLPSELSQTSTIPTASTTLTLSELSKKKDVPEPEPPPADDYQYYKEIERLLVADEVPPSTSSIYNKRLRKRAQNYLVIDGILFHNPKEPRRVVMTKTEQTSILELFHVTPSTGVHIGIKKMFLKLRAEYFWRGMYVGIATYVKNCTRCRDTEAISVPPHISKQNQQLDCQSSQSRVLSTSVQTTSTIWSDVCTFAIYLCFCLILS